jgi:hypothetical protein
MTPIPFPLGLRPVRDKLFVNTHHVTRAIFSGACLDARHTSKVHMIWADILSISAVVCPPDWVIGDAPPFRGTSTLSMFILPSVVPSSRMCMCHTIRVAEHTFPMFKPAIFILLSLLLTLQSVPIFHHLVLYIANIHSWSIIYCSFSDWHYSGMSFV